MTPNLNFRTTLPPRRSGGIPFDDGKLGKLGNAWHALATCRGMTLNLNEIQSLYVTMSINCHKVVMGEGVTLGFVAAP